MAQMTPTHKQMSYNTRKSEYCNDGDHKRCAFNRCHCWCHLFDEGVTSAWLSFKRGMERLFGKPAQWLKGTFPLVRQSTHKDRMQKLRESNNVALKLERARIDKELSEERDRLHELIGKMVRLSIERAGGSVDSYFRRYQIITQFDEEFIYRCFQHGNSQREIEYVAGYVAHQVEREMLTINFQRLFEADERARQRDARHYPPMDWSPNGKDFKIR
jgi:hypothetical protein